MTMTVRMVWCVDTTIAKEQEDCGTLRTTAAPGGAHLRHLVTLERGCVRQRRIVCTVTTITVRPTVVIAPRYGSNRDTGT